MANVRQMPELYLRGSLANITMANLTPEQKRHIEELFYHITTHPEMQRHKVRVMKELGVTIAADYADDREIAEEEYKIAIWRGIVDLFYHRKYSFRCGACDSSHYMTKRSKPKAIDRIDRIKIECPNCHQIEVEDVGDVADLKVGQFMSHSDFQAAYADMPDGWRAPKAKSPIIAIPGDKKYDDPEKIINDSKQLRKFFGEFVWNYFRQQINENKRKEHHKEPKLLLGRTDELLLKSILSLCNQMEIDCHYCSKTEPRDGRYTIQIEGLLTPPEFTAEFAQIKAKGALYGVEIIGTAASIEVFQNAAAPLLPVLTKMDKKTKKVISYQIEMFEPEHVSVLDNFACTRADEQDSDYTISQTSYRTVGDERMDQEDHVSCVDNLEVMGTIRDSLPEGHCRDVFDIFSQQGDAYLRFSEHYGDGEAKTNHVASFLGITPRAVNQHKEVISMHCLANDLIPN